VSSLPDVAGKQRQVVASQESWIGRKLCRKNAKVHALASKNLLSQFNLMIRPTAVTLAE
jgi:hypothetical protein